MSTIQAKQQPFSSGRVDANRSSLASSAAAKLIELSRALAGAEASASTPGLCSHCWKPRDSHYSTARCPNVFCSEKCEHEFVRAALAFLTIEDCVRMQRRLETLLTGAEATAR